MNHILKAYPRHSVDITKKEYKTIFSLLLSSRTLEGDCVSRFESMFARYINTQYAIAVSSARLGLYLLFKYFNFPEGSEIMITPFTHQSIFTVIKAFRFKPVFIDIDKDNHNIDSRLVKKLINKKTKILILTHMWGQPCEMDVFLELKKEFDIKIIEDCAMACGATYKNKKVGSFGDASIFSFGKAKAISTFDGGMLCTNDSKIYEWIQERSRDFNYRKINELSVKIINSMIANILTRPYIFFFTLYPILRFLNIRDPYNPMEHKKDSLMILNEIPLSWKLKFSNIQAAVGIEQLKNLDACNQKRIENAEILNNVLHGIKGIRILSVTPEAKNIYLYYPVFIEKEVDLNKIRKELIKLGVDSQLNELTTPEQLDVFGVSSLDYPVFNEASRKLLVIPNGIYLTEEDTHYVANAFKKVIERVA